MWMLAKQQNIPDCPIFTRSYQALLQLPRFRVTNQSHIDDEAAFHLRVFYHQLNALSQLRR
jgi:hypothetical protein